MSGEIQVRGCTPLVMARIGTSSAGSPGHSPFHMRREVRPCSWLTPLAQAERRRASTVMQKLSCSLSGFSRPRARKSFQERPSSPAKQRK
jgi:hypothetical protein